MSYRQNRKFLEMCSVVMSQSVSTYRQKVLKRVDHKSSGISFLDCLQPKHHQGCYCAVRMGSMLFSTAFLFLPLFTDFFLETKIKGGREMHWFVVSLIYAVIGCFLYVTWLEIEPRTLTYWQDALTNELPDQGIQYSFLSICSPLNHKLWGSASPTLICPTIIRCW